MDRASVCIAAWIAPPYLALPIRLAYGFAQMQNDLEGGQQFVQQELGAIAAESGRSVTRLEWHSTPRGFDYGYLTLRVSLAEESYIIKLRIKDLEDHATPEVAARLRHQLRQAVKVG